MTAVSIISAEGVSHQKDGRMPVMRALPEEVPVAVVFNGSTLAVMMATPAAVADFAHGFALTEGIIDDLEQIESFELVEHPKGLEARFWICASKADALGARRRSMAGPVGCGLCGIDSLDQAMRALPHVGDTGMRLQASEVARATDALRPAQELHRLTHATHAAGFLVPGQGIIALREDVGRHNALDKLIGALWRDGVDPSSGAVVMTSRLSVELVQKCAMAGIPALIAVSAPTGEALRQAEASGMTLVAFARGGGFDIYAHPHRILDEDSDVA